MNSNREQIICWEVIPLAGIPLFILLYFIAAHFYPGGHPGNPQADGFSWLHNYWCNLLNEQAINGERNTGRPVAMAGMIVLCSSLATFWFYYPVKPGIPRKLQWLIRITGPLAMGTALFITVFDHDGVTNIASLLGLIAVTGTLFILYKTKQTWLFRLGLLNSLLVAVNNLFYYTPSLLHLLPVVQKISFAAVLGWIWLCVYETTNFKLQNADMKKLLLLVVLFACTTGQSQITTRIELSNALFKTGDNPEWSKPGLDDHDWKPIKPQYNWEKQGFADYDGFGWYRFHFELSSLIKLNSFWPDSVRFFLAKMDDADEVYLNGKRISKTGRFPDDPGGYSTQWDRWRDLRIATNDPVLLWDKDNVLAIRVYDGGGIGGMFGGIPGISMPQLKDMASLEYKNKTLHFRHQLPEKITGVLTIKITDPATQTVVKNNSQTISAEPNSDYTLPLPTDPRTRQEIAVSFMENKSGQQLYLLTVPPYLLTPAPKAAPRINNATVFGVRPGSPFLFKIAATGEKPLQYNAVGLPKGLKLDPVTGIITGTLPRAGEHNVQLVVKNKKGRARQDFTIKCGDGLALTPPMGWNSWNCWGLSVSSEKVKASAQALIDNGLIDHGWSYMNIDDGWEAPTRNEKGEIVTNDKFPDMKALGDWLHSKGLKFGIYSSPGPLTCGGYLGSYQHEKQDADMYTRWGIDYLKYDWCSYGQIHGGKDTSTASYIKPYTTMQAALRAQPRDIVYSLCQYGMKDVWKWGHEVDGNCWRTTGDIEDTWESMYAIAFNQTAMQPYAKPGRWNDPDMLIVGNVGWGENLHPTRLTADEQYTHISLWSLLASPLLIGCDIASMDEFTLNLLSNDEVNAINQDAAGKQAIRVIKRENYQVWVKELMDGSKAIGIFNVVEKYENLRIDWTELGLEGNYSIRDCWRQKDLGTGNSYSSRIPPHGVSLIKISR